MTASNSSPTAAAAALASASPSPRRRPHNVPEALSSFVGRQAESEELQRLVRTVRLLTVVGAGGAGKTRLVREVAARLASETSGRGLPADAWSDGIWWVELAPVRTGADVASALASVLGVAPTPGRAMIDALLDALQHRTSLIVLDNCEHVIEDAARLVDAILRRAPQVTVLATSRERLAIDGEVAWPVPPLEHPREAPGGGWTEARLATMDAVRLFTDRTRAVQPAFALTDANAPAVAQICTRLDGLPLALELAAAVVPVIGVAGLAARLDDALTLLARGRRTDLPRHQTLRAVLDWSFDLLDDDARALLRTLAVFRGPFTLDAIIEVDGRPQEALIAPLGRLIEHSLVDVRESQGDARYRLLETVRQYGAAQLDASSDARVVRARHAQWITRVAQAAEDALFSPARGRTVLRLRGYLDEIRGALTWATGPDGDAALGAELAGALAWFWISGVPWEEARAWPRRVFEAIDAREPSDDRRPLPELLALGRLSYAVMGLAYFAGDAAFLLTTGARELAIWDRVESLGGHTSTRLTPAQVRAVFRGRSLCRQLLGFAEAFRGDGAAAVAHMDLALETAARSGEAWLHRVLQIRRALVHFTLGDLDRAEADYREAIPHLQAIGESWFLSLALEGLALTTLERGDRRQAAAHARESITVLHDEPDPWFLSRSLDSLAYILTTATSARDDEQAAFCVGAAEGLRELCGAEIMGNDRERHTTTRQRLEQRLDAAILSRCLAEGHGATLDAMFSRMAAITEGTASAVATTGEVRALLPQVPALTIALLGPLRIQQRGLDLASEAMPTGKGRELLSFLALTPQSMKEEIGLALWPDATAAQMRNIFHVTLHQLRRALGDAPWIVYERNCYRLVRSLPSGEECHVDVDVLLSTAGELTRAWKRRESVTIEQLQQWLRHLVQHRGALAPYAFGDWVVAHQDRLRHVWSDAMDALIHLAATSTAWEVTQAAATVLMEHDPLRESAHRAFMEALAASGERARALAHAESLAALLQREVGARPSPETRAVMDRLRRGA